MKTLFTMLLCLSALSQFSASACTLKNARAHLSSLNSVFQSYNRQIALLEKQGQTVPAALAAKRDGLRKNTAKIRKLFAKEVEKNARMRSSDKVDPLICDQYNAAIKDHALVLAKIELAAKQAKTKEPVCKRSNIRKRFGNAIRKQRTLTNSGKVSRKEQINFLNIATKFNKNIKTNFKQACLNLHEYEKQLTKNENN